MTDRLIINGVDLSELAVRVENVEGFAVPEPTETAAELLIRLRAEEGRPLHRARHLHVVPALFPDERNP